MKQQILFIHGSGEETYELDRKLMQSLKDKVGEGYRIIYPRIKTDQNAADYGWLKQIGREIDKLENNSILVGHSLGASFLLKYVTENELPNNLAGIFLLATPFWSGKEDWEEGLKLQEDFAD